jgi:hypothetical protein
VPAQSTPVSAAHGAPPSSCGDGVPARQKATHRPRSGKARDAPPACLEARPTRPKHRRGSPRRPAGQPPAMQLA